LFLSIFILFTSFYHIILNYSLYVKNLFAIKQKLFALSKKIFTLKYFKANNSKKRGKEAPLGIGKKDSERSNHTEGGAPDYTKVCRGWGWFVAKRPIKEEKHPFGCFSTLTVKFKWFTD